MSGDQPAVELLSEAAVEQLVQALSVLGRLLFASAEVEVSDAWPAGVREARVEARARIGRAARDKDLAAPPVASLASEDGFLLWIAGSPHVGAVLRGLARGDPWALREALDLDAAFYVESFARGANGGVWVIAGADLDKPQLPAQTASLARGLLRDLRRVRGDALVKYALRHRGRLANVEVPIIHTEASWTEYPDAWRWPRSPA